MEFIVEFFLEVFVSPIVDHFSKGNKRFEKFLKIITVGFIVFIIAAMLFSICYLVVLFMGLDWN